MVSVLLLPAGCGDEITPTEGDPPTEVTGTLVHTTGCKENIYGLAAPTVLDCVSWDWDGSGTLALVHVNAALNCCPGTIVGLVDIDGGNITIEETEGDDAIMCHCLCLYDITYEISGIEGEEITITIVEQYLPEGAEVLAVTIDLAEEPEGSRCLQRTSYPWGAGFSGEEPAGTIDDYSGCKELTGTTESTLPFSADSSCIVVYTMPADSSLRIFHINTAYNCCVDALDGGFEFGEGTITITGREHPPGGLCDCICLYDVSYTIHNLDPGPWTITFVEPYLPPGQEQLEITVDLSQAGSWTQCVHREGYPWGVTTSEEDDRAKLKELADAIIAYIGTPYCSGSDDCRYIGVGSKPCGGPWSYLIYSASTVDIDHLETLVRIHASFEEYMNIKYGYASTCDVPIPPLLECHDGICQAVR
jgi:hypothetical protein